MSGYVSPADLYMVTANPRKHVRHLTTSGWIFTGQVNAWSLYPICGTGDHDSRYVIALEDELDLPICRRCIRRFAEYAENLTAAGVTW